MRLIPAALLTTSVLLLPPARATDAAFNQDQVLVIDGRKVFPIGFTMPPPPGGLTPWGRDGIEELRDAGATFLRTGAQGGPWTELTIAREEQWLAAAARNHMHCLVYLREASGVRDGDAKAERLLRDLLTRFKDHPGLGAWKGADEPDWGKRPVPPMVRAYNIIKEVDPRHPVWVAQAPRGTIESMRAYAPAYDATGADIYPVGYPPGAHSSSAIFPNKEISLVGDYTARMTRVADEGNGLRKPVWMVLQIAWSGVLKPGKTLRMPTFPEQRYMTYQSIIRGARGLLYFGGSNPAACTPQDAKLGWNWTFWRKVLRPVVEESAKKARCTRLCSRPTPGSPSRSKATTSNPASWNSSPAKPATRCLSLPPNGKARP